MKVEITYCSIRESFRYLNIFPICFRHLLDGPFKRPSEIWEENHLCHNKDMKVNGRYTGKHLKELNRW